MDERAVRDRGFTLTEVIIVVVIMGLISVAIGGVFSVIVRTVPSTEARADDARSLLGLSTWLPADVNSTPMMSLAEADTPSASFDRRSIAGSGCSSGNEGDNLLRLTWTESYTATVSYHVSYRFVERNDGWHIVRVACTNGGPGSSLNLTAALPPPTDDPVSVRYKDDDGRIVGVVVEVTTVDGESIRIDTVSQDPDETLPPLGSVTLDPTTTTESTTTTTTVPASSDGDCSLLSDLAGVDQVPTPATSPLLRDGSDGAEGPLTAPVVVETRLRFDVDVETTTIASTPQACSTLQLSYLTGVADVVAPMTVTATCGVEGVDDEEGQCLELAVDAVFELPSVSAEVWTTGTHPAQLVDGADAALAGTDTSFVVEVDPDSLPPECTAAFVDVTPNPVHNSNNANGNSTNGVKVGPLHQEVTVTVSKGENCGNLGLEYEHEPGSIGWKPFGGSSEVVLERSNLENWEDGHRPLRLRDGQSGDILATTTLEIL